MRIPEAKITDIADRLSMYEVVSDYVDLKEKGNRYWGLCPFHSEKTPSFTVSEDKKMFYCFGCHKGGSMFSFISEIENITFPEAVEKLAEKAGVELVINGKDDKEDKKYTAMMELYSRITKSLHFLLLEKENARYARTYLQKRGIENKTIKDFQLGYVPDDRFWIYNFLIRKNYSPEFLEQSGLFSKKNKKISLFSNRIMFPVVNALGKTVAFSGRQLGSFGGKYINTPETFFYKKREMLYGLFTAVPSIREKKEFILVEGNFDVLALYQSGICNVVAPLGTAFTEEQGKVLRRYAKKCKIFFDKDHAGLSATLRTAIILEKLNIETEVIEPKGGDDPADILQKQSSGALNKLLKYPINTFEYIVNKAAEINDTTDPEGKRAVFNFVVPYIASMESAITRESYLNKLAEKLQVNINAVVNDFSAVKEKEFSGKRPFDNRFIDQNTDDEIVLTKDLFFMISVVAHLSVFTKIRSELALDDFTDSYAREIFIIMEDLFRREELNIDYLFEKIKDQKLKNMIKEKILKGEFDVNIESVIKDGVNDIKRRSLENKRNNIVLMLNRAEIEGNLVDVKQLLSEKMYLDEELNKVKVK